MCKSKWGYCGTGDEYCGENCTKEPCTGGNKGNGTGNSNNSIITEKNFACAFNTIDDKTRGNRLNSLRNSGWAPSNKDEAAVFLAHVFHETDGLRTLKEYCAPDCASHYAGSWCGVEGQSGKLYYARQALSLDLLNIPDWAEQKQDVAVKTVVWFYNTNKMGGPAKQDEFAATTRIINGQLECNKGSGYKNQLARVERYQ